MCAEYRGYAGISSTYGIRRHYGLPGGVHFIQVAKWLGHGSYVPTLTTYADYIPEETENPLPEPVAAVPKTNVVNLHRSTAG